MKALILIAVLVMALLPIQSLAKGKKSQECSAFFTAELVEVDTELSSPYLDGVRLHFDIINKNKKGFVLIDGIVGIKVKGVKDYTFISTDTLEWDSPVYLDEKGTFTIEVSKTGMNLTALARGGELSVSSGMLSAEIMYEDGTVKQCGSSDGVFPMMPYF